MPKPSSQADTSVEPSAVGGRRSGLPVQVDATPVKAKRTFGSMPPPASQFYEDDEQTIQISPPRFSLIPSSATRLSADVRGRGWESGRSSMLPPALGRSGVAVDETPHAHRYVDPLQTTPAGRLGEPESSPASGRGRRRGAESPMRRRGEAIEWEVEASLIGKRLEYSPSGAGSDAGGLTAMTSTRSGGNQSAGAKDAGASDSPPSSSLYKTLGWDDEADELL